MVGVSYYYPELTPNINRAMRTKTKKAASSKVKVEVAANNLDFDPIVVSFPVEGRDCKWYSRGGECHG